MKTKKRNATDLTLRNNRARSKEIAALEKRVKRLEALTEYYADCFHGIYFHCAHILGTGSLAGFRERIRSLK